MTDFRLIEERRQIYNACVANSAAQAALFGRLYNGINNPTSTFQGRKKIRVKTI